MFGAMSGGGGYSGESSLTDQTSLSTSTGAITFGSFNMGGGKDPMAEVLKWGLVALAVAWAIKSK